MCNFDRIDVFLTEYTVRTAEIRQKKGVNRRVESFFLSEENRGVESFLSESRQVSVSEKDFVFCMFLLIRYICC